MPERCSQPHSSALCEAEAVEANRILHHATHDRLADTARAPLSTTEQPREEQGEASKPVSEELLKILFLRSTEFITVHMCMVPSCDWFAEVIATILKFGSGATG